MSRVPKPSTPEGYFIPTLNKTGFMSAWVSDAFMRGFIDFSSRAPGPALDVGAAYGVATLPALLAGATVIANDNSAEQLEILQERVSEEERTRLRLLVGNFPGELDLGEESVGAILLARILHFFKGETIRESFEKCHAWLRPGGRIFITAETPYLGNIRSFIPEYEKRRSDKAPWPGWIEDFAKWDLRKGVNLPEQMHLLDEDVLSRELKRAGFEILILKKFPRPEFPLEMQLDGRESVGAVAVKVA